MERKNTDLIVQQTHTLVVDGIPDQGILVVVAFHFEQVYDLIALVCLLFLLVTHICCKLYVCLFVGFFYSRKLLTLSLIL